MELTLRTLQGNAVMRDLMPTTSVQQLKQMIYDACTAGQISLEVPTPEKQRLVYMDKVLDSGDLAGAGITSDDTLVLLAVPDLPPAPAADNTPMPTAASIKVAITEEAKARGIEGQLREEAPPRRRFAGMDLLGGLGGDAGDMDNRLMNLLEALEGRLNIHVPPGGVAARGGAGAAGEGAAGTPAQQAAEMEALQQAAQEAARLLSALVGPAGMAGMGGMGGMGGMPLAGMFPPVPPLGQMGQAGQAGQGQEQAQEQQPAQEQPLQVPEPSADGIAQLAEMGFSEALARKALLLCRNNVDAALEWVLQHMEDEDAEQPPTEEQLRQVYGPPPRPTAAALTSQLVDMGFERNAAAAAVRRFNNLDLAVAYLLQTPGASMANAAGGQAAAAAAAGGAGAAAGQAGSNAQAGAGQAPQRGAPQPQQPGEAAAAAQAEQHGTPGAAAAADNMETDAAAQHEEHAEGDEVEVEDEEEYGDEYEDAHDEYEDDDGEYEDEDEDEEGEGFADGEDYGLALGRYGSMDLAQMGSADMEQLLEGVGDIYTGHLAGLDASLGPLQGMLLRMLDAPASGGNGVGASDGGAAGASGGGAAGAGGAGTSSNAAQQQQQQQHEGQEDEAPGQGQE